MRVLKSLIPESRCIFSLKRGCEWAEKRREQESPTHKPSIWPLRYLSITTCWWNTASHTRTRASSHARAYLCTGSGIHRRTLVFVFTSKHVISLILATHQLHCVQPAATVEQYSTLPTSYGSSASSCCFHFLHQTQTRAFVYVWWVQPSSVLLLRLAVMIQMVWANTRNIYIQIKPCSCKRVETETLNWNPG